MQPQFVHSPPISSISTSASFLPAFASVLSATSPPGPAPRMTASKRSSATAVHLHVDLDGFLVLGEVPQHLLVVLEAVDRRRQQLPQPAGVERLRLDEVVDAADEVV